MAEDWRTFILLEEKHEMRNPKRFDRFDKLTAGRLTALPVLSGIEGSKV